MAIDLEDDITSDEQATELWRVAESGDVRGLEHALVEGVDVNATTAEGVTALMRAASHGHSEMVEALVGRGADVNLARADGFNALTLAAFFGHGDVVQILVEHGADPAMATRWGTSADMWASARSFPEVAEYLGRARVKTNDEDASAIEMQGEAHDGQEYSPLQAQHSADDVEYPEATRYQPQYEIEEELMTEADSDHDEVTLAGKSYTASNYWTVPVLSPAPASAAPQGPVVNEAAGQEAFVKEPVMQEPVVHDPPVKEPVLQESAVQEAVAHEPLVYEPVVHEPVVHEPVVHCLKEPPDIWDLVPEQPAHFQAGATFVSRVTADNTKLFMLTLAVMFVCGVGTFAVLKLSQARRNQPIVQARVEHHEPPAAVVTATPAAPAAEAPIEKPVADSVANESAKPASVEPSERAVAENRRPEKGDSVAKRIESSPRSASKMAVKAEAVAKSRAVNPTTPKHQVVATASPHPTRNVTASAATPVVGNGETRPRLVHARTSDSAIKADESRAPRSGSETVSSKVIGSAPKTSANSKSKVIRWP